MKIENGMDRSKFSNVWIVAELLSGKVQPVTYELIGAARKLADKRSSQVWGIVMGESAFEDIHDLFAYGADAIVLLQDVKLKGFNDELESNVLARLIEKYRPEIILGAATARGRALMPRVAVKTYSGLTADCTGLEIDPENGDLLQTRPAFGGNIMATIRSTNHRPQMATVRPRVMQPLEPDFNRSGTVIGESITKVDDEKVKRVIEVFRNEGTSINLSDARIIISGGRAMKGPDGFKLLQEFADMVGGAVGASRAAVDSGWISYPHQVGQTGQTVQTTAYIACGISGQIQHLIGMQSCDTIIAIDKNPNTPMMQLADIAIVGDLFEIIPAIIEELRSNG